MTPLQRGRTIFVADAHRGDGKRFVVRADEKLTAFLELERESKRGTIHRVKYWEIIAQNLKKRGWSLGYVSAIDSNGRTIFVADAHRGDGKRFVERADEKLTAFMELESAIRHATVLLNRQCARAFRSRCQAGFKHPP